MAGKPGRSGGGNRLTAEQHRVRGTFRADRHGAAPRSPLREDIAARLLRMGEDLADTAGGLLGVMRKRPGLAEDLAQVAVRLSATAERILEAVRGGKS